MLPGVVTAAPSDYPVRRVYDYCAGADDNQVNLKMRISARGYTTANRLTIDSWAQRKVNGRWQTVYRWDRAGFRFEPDGNRHTLAAWRSYNGTNAYPFRIVFRLRAWHNSTVLRSTLARSVVC
jgi:hypothetical protein